VVLQPRPCAPGCDFTLPGTSTADALGIREYDVAQASLTRSLSRLQQRGLVTVYHGCYSRWAGLVLTEHAVKTVEIFHSPHRTGETVGTGAVLPRSQPVNANCATPDGHPASRARTHIVRVNDSPVHRQLVAIATEAMARESGQ
jgi:hypothetical protein